jgi:glycosyltransferase involved in cell wall biosynthesis
MQKNDLPLIKELAGTRVTVIVPGRLHAFYLAKYFQDQGLLYKLITGYPAYKVKKYGIKPQYIRPVYINEIINRTTNLLFRSYPLDFVACEAMDILNSIWLPKSDVYFIWSGYALHTIRAIRKKYPAARIILVRGSAHIEVQNELLKKMGAKKLINPKIIAKEMKEYEACDAITVPSLFAKRTFESKGVRTGKIFLNPLGVNLTIFPYYERTQSPGLVVGYVGQLSSRKNISSLIDVVEQLTKKGMNITLRLVGKIDHESFDKNLLQKEFIEYIPHVEEKALPGLYNGMDVFVLNTVEDGFAVVLLQAMSTGLPVVATRNSGGPDVIVDNVNGFLIDAFDNAALQEKLAWCYDNKDKLPGMGKKSADIARDGFSWNDFGARHLQFLKNILTK